MRRPPESSRRSFRAQKILEPGSDKRRAKAAEKIPRLFGSIDEIDSSRMLPRNRVPKHLRLSIALCVSGGGGLACDYANTRANSFLIFGARSNSQRLRREPASYMT